MSNQNLSSQQFRVTGPSVRVKHPTGKRFSSYNKAVKYANKKTKKTGEHHIIYHPNGKIMYQGDI